MGYPRGFKRGSKVDFIDSVSITSYPIKARRALMAFMLRLEVTRNKSYLDV